jgi:hypothetical protein
MEVSLYDKLDKVEISPWLFLVQHKYSFMVKFGLVSMHGSYEKCIRTFGWEEITWQAWSTLFFVGYLMVLSVSRPYTAGW